MISDHTIMKLKLPLIFISGLLLILAEQTFGQGYCRQNGGFTLDKTAGCAPLTVTVTNTVAGADPDAITYFYGYTRGSNTLSGGTNSTTNVYGIVGTRTILQQGYANNNIFYQCQDIIVYESGAPNAQYSSCGGGKIKLTLTNNAFLTVYDQIEIKWGDSNTEVWKQGDGLNLEHTYASTAGNPIITIRGIYTSNTACAGSAVFSMPVSFQQVQLANIAIQGLVMRADGSIRLTYQGLTSIPTSIQYSTDASNYTTSGVRSSGGVQPYDISGLNVNQVYQLKLSSEDLCASKLETNPVSSMVLSGKSVDGKNTLTWNKYGFPTGFTEYALLRDGNLIKTFTSIDETTYTDEDIECGSYSEYQLVAKINGITSTSAPVALKADLTSARPIDKAYVTVNDNNNVIISANVPSVGLNSTYYLTIEKAEAGSAVFKKIITLANQNQYSDIEVKTNEISYCYRMSYTNSCDQEIPATEPICTVLLKNQFLNMSWTPEKPVLPTITSYDILQTGSGGSQTETNVQLSSSYTPTLNSQSDLEYTFQIRANSADNNFQSFSNLISISRNANIFIPGAFSPNGDGTNDILEAKATLLQSFALSVFNRWGNVVFHSDDINKGWDGTINGANAPAGSYAYKLKAVDIINQAVEKKGTFMLLR